MKSVAILGSTGSIGTQSLEVAARYPDRIRVVSLAASTSVGLLAKQCARFHPEIVSVRGPDEARKLADLLSGETAAPEIVYGSDGLLAVTEHPGITSVVNGLVGSVGLTPTLAALRNGLEVLLANKESLVMAGDLIKKLVADGSCSIIPVDSEHSAIYQCLNGNVASPGLSRIILTASGGPFRDRHIADFDSLTVEEALSHPTWKMGPKITVDSATLMNKGLEIIEAHHLFSLPPDRIDVVIHPSSIVHSFVEFSDGSLLAQLSHPTMEIPIQYALLGGDRMPSTVKKLDLAELGSLEFFPPDSRKFPAMELARESLRMGGTAPAVLNGANEKAVGLFLDRRIKFPMITRLAEKALSDHTVTEATESAIMESDSWARDFVERSLENHITKA